MQERQALDAFGALSQESRLRIVRLLVQAGPRGMAAGAISEAIGSISSTTSFHLGHLERAGLVQSRREARSIIYTASYTGLSSLARFLMQDCCAGRHEVCAPVIADLSCLCADETNTEEPALG
jgi:ArsR family transcriptional regulator